MASLFAYERAIRMTEHELLELINSAKQSFGSKCSKYAGAICAELIKQSLSLHGISTSARDVFIEGVPIEIDLLIPHNGVVPKNGVLYRADDVLVVLEIKNSGVFDKETLPRIRQNFELIQSKNQNIVCVYVTIAELKGYRYAATSDNIGFAAYTLFLHNHSPSNRKYEATGQWAKMLEDLRNITCVDSRA
jgi:hypothetical protein